jgi:hypothetical protein
MTYNGALFRIVPYAAGAVNASLSPSTPAAAFPVANLANIQPKVVMRTDGIDPVSRQVVINIDLGEDTALDGIAVLHTNLQPTANWAVLGTTAAQGPMGALGTEPGGAQLFTGAGDQPFGFTPTTRENRRFAFIHGAARTVRYLRFYIRQAVGVSFIEIGTLLVLQRLALGQDAFGNFELGSGRRVDDRSQIRPLPGGETAIERGGRVPQWRAAWSNMTEAQMRELWSLLMDVGTGAPILAAEFQDGSPGQAEALHYGLIQNIDFSERTQLDKNRIELRFQELL